MTRKDYSCDCLDCLLKSDQPEEMANMKVETKARAATTCPACGIEKDKGLLVCWACFKKPGGLKYSGLTLSAWLAAQQTAQEERDL